jgi:hypothetical protein
MNGQRISLEEYSAFKEAMSEMLQRKAREDAEKANAATADNDRRKYFSTRIAKVSGRRPIRNT